MKHIFIIALCVLCSVPFARVRAQDEFEPGKVIVLFTADTPEEDAVSFVRGFNLEIVKKGRFDPPLLYLVVKQGAREFVRDAKRERTVLAAEINERFEQEGQSGIIVKITFKPGVTRAQIEALRDTYLAGGNIAAWRFHRVHDPFIIVNVPAGKERHWVSTFGRAEYSDTVKKARLLSYDFPS